jgi:hypothetical protein
MLMRTTKSQSPSELYLRTSPASFLDVTDLGEKFWLIQKFGELPENVRRLLISVEVSRWLREELSKKTGLNLEQATALAQVIRDIFLNLVKLTEFVAELERRLKISRPQAQEIAQLVQEHIFAPVAVQLRRIQAKPPLQLPPRPPSLSQPPSSLSAKPSAPQPPLPPQSKPLSASPSPPPAPPSRHVINLKPKTPPRSPRLRGAAGPMPEKPLPPLTPPK